MCDDDGHQAANMHFPISLLSSRKLRSMKACQVLVFDLPAVRTRRIVATRARNTLKWLAVAVDTFAALISVLSYHEVRLLTWFAR